MKVKQSPSTQGSLFIHGRGRTATSANTRTNGFVHSPIRTDLAGTRPITTSQPISPPITVSLEIINRCISPITKPQALDNTLPKI